MRGHVVVAFVIVAVGAVGIRCPAPGVQVCDALTDRRFRSGMSEQLVCMTNMGHAQRMPVARTKCATSAVISVVPRLRVAMSSVVSPSVRTCRCCRSRRRRVGFRQTRRPPR